MVEIKFLKTHEDAKLPVKNHVEDSGLDVFSVEDKLIPSKGSAIVNVGLQVAYISEGFWFKIEARSGLGFKHGIQPHPGIIDSLYRGQASIKLYNFGNEDYKVHKGDRIAQFVVYPLIESQVNWTHEINETKRGENGFGSSGK